MPPAENLMSRRNGYRAMGSASVVRAGLLVIACAFMTSIGVWAAETRSPWPMPVKGFSPPEAGEHPRLFFRKADVAEIRRRSQTPEGRAIVKRLRILLNGSDG